MTDAVTDGEVPKELRLNPFEEAVVELFVHVAQSFGLQRSLGQIYGLLYAKAEPQCLDGIVGQLGLSKGSVSQGLRSLRSLGALSLVHIPGDRRDHYAPEIRLRKLVAGILTNQVSVALEHGADRLSVLRQHLQSDGAGIPELHARIDKLTSWHGKFQRLVPVIKGLVGNE